MKRRKLSSFVRLILLVLNWAVVVEAQQDVLPWSCDALTPSLCDLQVETNVVSMRGGIQVRYWRYTNTFADNSTISNPPLIVIHGGPAWPHDYLLPLKQIACSGNRPVLFYDQAGCGQSKLPLNVSVADYYPWLLDPDYYALEELPALIRALGIRDYHILGHSWGTILSQLFALNATGRIRDGLRSLTLSGCISDTQLYIQSQWDPIHGTLGRLPPFVQDRIRTLEEAQLYDSNEYHALDDVLTSFFTLRTAPVPDCYLQSAEGVNPEIYVAMQGASEFTMSGVLEDFNVTGRLSELAHLPVLLTTGSYDTVRPVVAETMQRQLPLSERVLFHRSGHVTMLDEAGKMNAVVSDFISRVDVAKRWNQPFVPQSATMDSSEDGGGLMSSSSSSSITAVHGDAPLTSSWILFILSVAGVASLGFFMGGVLVGFMLSSRYRARQGYHVIGVGR